MFQFSDAKTNEEFQTPIDRIYRISRAGKEALDAAIEKGME